MDSHYASFCFLGFCSFLVWHENSFPMYLSVCLEQPCNSIIRKTKGVSWKLGDSLFIGSCYRIIFISLSVFPLGEHLFFPSKIHLKKVSWCLWFSIMFFQNGINENSHCKGCAAQTDCFGQRINLNPHFSQVFFLKMSWENKLSHFAKIKNSRIHPTSSSYELTHLEHSSEQLKEYWLIM